VQETAYGNNTEHQMPALWTGVAVVSLNKGERHYPQLPFLPLARHVPAAEDVSA
jgi:hypothetical protein